MRPKWLIRLRKNIFYYGMTAIVGIDGEVVLNGYLDIRLYDTMEDLFAGTYQKKNGGTIP